MIQENRANSWFQEQAGLQIILIQVHFLKCSVSGKAMNGGKYSNKVFDENMEAAARMAPGPERFAKLRKAEDVFITEDHGVMPIYHYVSQSMIDTNVWGGWYPNAMDWHPTKFIYKK